MHTDQGLLTADEWHNNFSTTKNNNDKIIIWPIVTSGIKTVYQHIVLITEEKPHTYYKDYNTKTTMYSFLFRLLTFLNYSELQKLLACQIIYFGIQLSKYPSK